MPEHLITSEDEDWKCRPPYQIQSPDQFGPVKWHGKCECGRVTFQLNRERPLNAKYCHCRGCQVMHGAPFQWAAIFHKSDMTFTQGAKGLSFYSSTNRTTRHETPTKVSCSFCKSPIMDEGRRVCLLFPGSIDYGVSHADRSNWRRAFEVSCHIFYGQRSIDILDGKAKWSAMDGESDPLDDHGQPI